RREAVLGAGAGDAGVVPDIDVEPYLESVVEAAREVLDDSEDTFAARFGSGVKAMPGGLRVDSIPVNIDVCRINRRVGSRPAARPSRGSR
ncbi:hypothetical protein, partial [Prescottella defluvii]|uniref:hypothetical protein n=1 Tax=Prescottella defluvii TaxID=1323361 RepID=UPI001E557368